MKNLAVREALADRLPALVELEPMTCSFEEKIPVPMAAEETVPYQID